MSLAFCHLFLHFGGLGPQQWRHSDITAIPKSSEVGQGIDASRPIGLMEVLGTVVMSWLDKQVTQVWHRHKILSVYQFGFQRHCGVCEAARMVDLRPYTVSSWSRQTVRWCGAACPM